MSDDSRLRPIAYGPTWQTNPDGTWKLPERTLGWEILGWASKYLLQPDGPQAGQPWRYTPEQARFLLWWYALGEHDQFTYRYGVYRRLKGAGKDPAAATLALIELCGPCRPDGNNPDGSPKAKPHPAPWVQVAAVTQEQTRNTFVLFPGMISDALKDTYSLDIGKTLIYAHHGKGRLEAVTSSPRAMEGGRATFIIANETHLWIKANEGHAMMAVIRRNASKARDGASRALSITNAHLPGEDSIGQRDWEAFEQELSGEKQSSGLLYDSLEANAALDPTDPEDIILGIKQAAGDATWINVARVASEYGDPTANVAESQRFYFNRICGSDAAWINLEAWKSIADTSKALEPGERICLGFDGSLRQDSTALVACRLSDGHIWTLKVWEKPNGPLGNGWQVPREEVAGHVDACFTRYDVVYLYADPPHWQDYVDAWAAKYGDKTVIEFHTNSGVRMARALERLHTSILAAELTHDGDPTLTRHIGNAVAVVRAGGTQINKRKKSDKIDAVVAATLAYEARNDAIAAGALSQTPVAYYSWSQIEELAKQAEDDTDAEQGN